MTRTRTRTRTRTSTADADTDRDAYDVARGLVVLGTVVYALAACTSGQDNAVTARTPAATRPAAVSTTTPRASLTKATTTPSSSASTSAPGPAVGKALAAAINDLSNKNRNLVRLDEARKRLQTGNDALRQARTSVTAIRSAVYGSSRNCTAAKVQNSIVLEKTGVAASSAGAAIAAVISRRGELVGLAQAATAVERQVTAQGSTLVSMPNVKAAVTSARSAIVTETGATNSVNDAATSLRNNALQLSANGSQILAKTC